ncbi:MAG: cobalamin-independent methionine synthase II family protein [Gammaproteobacteria bacterium]|nr:cobalamin-independent methionine synthase II family protein [Gammaproteobacteria bacterium]
MTDIVPPFDQILTTHVGSLPRPESLLTLMHPDPDEMPIDSERLQQALADAVQEIVSRQVETGISLISDGEMSKPSYATYITERLTGFSGEFRGHAAQDLLDYRDFARRQVEIGAVVPNAGGACCRGEVSVKSLGGLQADLARFRAAVELRQPPGAFMNAASPGVIAMFQKNEYYPDDETYIEAVAMAMRHEFEAIVDAGFVLQIDCPDLAMGRHLAFMNLSEAQFLKIVRRNIEALNLAVENIPASKMRMHVCWGNYPGPHHRDIPLAKIIGTILDAKPAYLLLEGANPRHEHEWRVFEEFSLPDDKVLVPGVVDSTSNYIEHPDLVAERICRYADVIGRERVMAGTDCGFSTFRDYPTVHPDIAWAKLESLVEGAYRATERLW